jgi:drug/metabolite transporter (DMT)-like permease
MLFPIFARLFSTGMHAAACVNDAHLSNTVFKKIVPLVFYTQLMVCVIAIPVVLLFGMPAMPSWEIFVVLLMVAAIDVGYQIPYYAALRRIDTSVVVAMFSLSRILVPITAFFLIGERLSVVQYFGFIVIVAAILALNFKRSSEENKKKIRINSAFFLMAAVAVMLSLETVLKKYALNNMDWHSVLFWYLVLGVGITMTFLLSKRNRRDITEASEVLKKHRKSLGAMLLFTVPPMFTNIWSLGYLPASVHKAIGSVQSVFTLIINLIMHKFGYGKLCKEEIVRKDIARKLFYFAIIIVGVVMAVVG